MAEIINNKLITLVRFKGSEPPHIRFRTGGHRLTFRWPSREEMFRFMNADHDDETDDLVAAMLRECRTEDANLGAATAAIRMVQFRLRTIITRL